MAREDERGWDHALAVVRPALVLAPRSFVDDRRAELRRVGVAEAVKRQRSGPVVDWLLKAMELQGIGDAAALAFANRQGRPRHAAILAGLVDQAACPKLRCFWTYSGCCFRRDKQRCAEPRHLPQCVVPTIPARKGALAVGAVSLVLFVSDVAAVNLVGWIDRRLAVADAPGLGERRGEVLAASVVEPLAEVAGFGPKVASMTLADLLLAADPGRERWVAAGANMIAIDSLIHNFLHRTGILRRLGAEHCYGDRCHRPDGCAGVVRGLARRIDARAFNPAFPSIFPRFVQASLWSFCAEGGRSICNGNQIADDEPCRQAYCPAGHVCDRLALRSLAKLKSRSGALILGI